MLAPHPDDEVLGCGGAVCRHRQRGDQVAAVFLTSGELGLKHLPREEARRLRETEANRAARVLGIAPVEFLRLPDWYLGEQIEAAVAALAPLVARTLPHLIYLPHPQEWHPDHQAALPIARKSVGGLSNSPPLLLGYEIWTPLSAYDHIENISDVMPQKLRALRAHRSQLGEFDYIRLIKGLNQYRGVIGGKCAYAEVFQTLPL